MKKGELTGLEIAIIGMALKFPGADCPKEFWENLKAGKESISFYGKGELKEMGVDNSLLKDHRYVPSGGGMIEGKEYFDAAFFGYTPEEAILMDPQIRIFHELAWKALEDSSYDLHRYEGRIGLYAGSSNSFYWEALAELSGASGDIGRFAAVQLSSKDFLTSRISHKLNLKGPSLPVQTACSTSLVAVHLASRALLLGECDIAMAGGITISTQTAAGYLYQEGMILSKDGHCRPFDANASGTNSGNGGGVVVLKPLQKAIKDRDNIYAVIKGSAINNDGNRKTGYTAPSIKGQMEVIRAALNVARVEPETIQYVECHGTATALGDPIELEALRQAFGDVPGECAIGSVKSNFGHLDSAAGIAGLIKTALCLQYKYIVPSLHFERLNPAINGDGIPFVVNTELKQWMEGKTPRRAGVSSFGIGGTNAHLILEEAPAAITMPPERKYELILTSARTAFSLESMRNELTRFLSQNSGINLADAAYSLMTGRSAFAHRSFFVAKNDPVHLKELDPDTLNYKTFVNSGKVPEIIFLFPGGGSQYLNMAKGIYDSFPEFRAMVDEGLGYLHDLTGLHYHEFLFSASQVPGEAATAGEAKISEETEIALPLLFIVEYALAKQLITWGITPAGMIGHSLGEYVAACIAGVFTYEDALSLVLTRGKLMQKAEEGLMLSIPCAMEKISSLITEEFSIAAINSPSNCVVAGSRNSITNLKDRLAGLQIDARIIHIAVASHSKMMDPILDEFEEAVRQIPLNKPGIGYLSNVTGDWIKPEQLTSKYWAGHIRSTVQFSKGLEKVISRHPGCLFIEVGPGNILSSLVRQHDISGINVVNILRHPNEAMEDDCFLLGKLGELWSYGCPFKLDKLFDGQARNRVSLPGYAFDRQRYWIDKSLEELSRSPGVRPLKSKKTEDWFYHPVWRGSLAGKNHPAAEVGTPCVVLKDGSDFSDALVAELQKKMSGVVVAEGPEQAAALLAGVAKKNASPFRVVYITGFAHDSGSFSDPFNAASVERALEWGFYGVIDLVKAINAGNVPDKIEIDIVTNKIHDVLGEGNFAYSPIVGAARVISQEYPHIECNNIDMSVSGNLDMEGPAIAQLAGELLSPAKEPVLALRNNKRWVPYFEQCKINAAQGPQQRLRHNGTYLITGGLGRIGFTLLDYISRTYKANLIITGTTEIPGKKDWDNWLAAHGMDHPSSERIMKIRRLEENGSVVVYRNIDICRKEDMKGLVEEAVRTFAKIDGIIHSIAVTDSGSFKTVEELNKAACEKHFHGKIYGLLSLSEAVKDLDYDFCLLMSSISSVLGGLGFAPYAAANIFMDHYAGFMAASANKNWISVGWDAWEYLEDEGKETPAGSSIAKMSVEEGAAALETVLNWGVTGALVQSLTSLDLRINEWVNRKEETTESTPDQGQLYSRPEMLTPCKEPVTPTQVKLVAIWRDFFKYDKIGINDGFFELGGNSLKGVSLISIIHRVLKVQVPIKEFFARGSIARLAEWIDQSGTRHHKAIPVAETREYYPLSSAQLRLFLVQEVSRNSIGYNETYAFEIKGNLQGDLLEKCLRESIAAHEIFRTRVFILHDQPVQRVLDRVDFQVQRFGCQPEEVPSRIAEFVRPFDLAEPPYLRSALLRVGTEHHVLLLDLHHIITDGISANNLMKELSLRYSGKTVTSGRIRYKDYATWQHGNKRSEHFKKQREFWLREFAGEIPRIDLPLSFDRPAIRRYEGGLLHFGIPENQVARLYDMVKENGVSLYVILLTIYSVFLSRLSNQKDVIVGTPASGRPDLELEDMMGMFVNTVVLRNMIDEELSFEELLKKISEKTFLAFENQDYQYEELVEDLKIIRDPSRNPLFDVVFTFQNMETEEIRVADISFLPFNYANPAAKFDLILAITEQDKKLYCSFNYATSLFTRAAVERFISGFLHVVEGVVRSSSVPVKTIPVISEQEQQSLLARLNGPEADYPREATILSIFEQQVGKFPDKVAVVFDNVSLTYAELNKKANGVAISLQNRSVRKGAIVALYLDQSVEAVVGMLGIVKAGCAYLPIDINYPAERVGFILKDSAAAFLLTTRDGIKNIKAPCEALFLDNDEIFAAPVEGYERPSLGASDLLYVIYTSGTTGNPKGAMIPHKNVIRLLFNSRFQFDFSEKDTWSLFHSHAFDFSVWEMYGALLYGGQLVIIPKSMAKDSGAFCREIVARNITILNQTPTAFYNLSHEIIKGDTPLRYVIFGGEALSPGKLHAFGEKFPDVRLINMYGITETTVHVTFKKITKVEIGQDLSNIGQPIPTLTAYILDKNLHVQPIGVPGELCVGGEGVATGYLNRPELTAERFIESPYKAGERLYRSGDLVQLLENGEMVYLGRMDQQVKIRGYRIELAEIENRLIGQEGISQAVVIALANSEGEKSLCAYFVAPGKPSIADLRSWLYKKLPDHMVPSFFVQVDSWPLTHHGKIDIKALPKPASQVEEERGLAPRNEREAGLVRIWRSVLDLDRIGINSNFFHLGGDSIKAIRLINAINAHFNSDIRIADLYLNETVEKLAPLIAVNQPRVSQKDLDAVLDKFNDLKNAVLLRAPDPDDIGDVYPMTEIERGMVFNYLKNSGKGVYHDQFLFNLKFRDLRYDLFIRALELLTEKHEVLRSSFNINDYDDFVQIVHRTVELSVGYEDLSGLSRPEYIKFIKKELAADIKNTFNEKVPPLWRMKLLKYDKQDYTLLFVFHHAILDGWSVASFMTELNNTYYALCSDHGYMPEQIRSSYRDAALQEYIEKSSPAKLGFWKNELADYQRLELSFLPVAEKKGGMNIYKRKLSGEMFGELNRLSQKLNTSLKNILFGAYVYALKIFSPGQEVIAGWVTNNRPLKEDADQVLGCFLNTVPVRVRIPGGCTYAQFIRFIDEKLRSIKDYEAVPLFEIAKAIGEKNKDNNPIFDTLFNFVNFHIYENAKIADESDNDEQTGSFSDGNQNTNTLFDFEVSVTWGDLYLLPKYDAVLISEEFVGKFCDYYTAILDKFLHAGDEGMSINNILSDKEKSMILDAFNDTSSGYNRDITLHRVFEEKASELPGYPAITHKGEEVTYEELNERANRLAASLRLHGVSAGIVVGILMERSVNMIVGMMGVLKAGGAYVPLEPDLPDGRIAGILGSLQVDTLITSDRILPRIEKLANELPALSQVYCPGNWDSTGYLFTHKTVKLITQRQIDLQPGDNLPPLSTADDPAYIIFTSGSTGVPKGVLVRNRPVINIIEWVNNTFGVSPADKLLFITSIGFDLSVYDVFGILAAGGTVHLLGYDEMADPGNILDTIVRQKITIWDSAPAAMQLVAPLFDRIRSASSALRLIMLSGDWIPVTLPDILKDTFRGTEVLSLGGATEATIWSNYYKIGKVEGYWKSIPYGKPTQNCKYYIFTEKMEVCPIGIAGDLYIGGECLASGYVNDPDLTSLKFIPNPFNPDEIIYRTGDLARWFEDGNMEFLGRKDGQVKIRGFRIETGEIESILTKHPAIRNAVVLAHTNKQNEKSLCAYLVLKNEKEQISVSVIKKHLSESVPEYMVPDHFLFLPKIPVTVNGKVDRKLLPAPEVKSEVEFIPPSNEIERKLEEIWSGILGIEDRISSVADFFHLGGHSLNVTLLISQIQKNFQITISIREMFANPTIRSQAALISIISPLLTEEESLPEDRETIII